ncbi:hypothetical protein C8N24_5150 [Solirubrobacter pauli]|uniref:Uncharacterized protein n=1 Tax=Solirubrobacter pauli TaxID=166793 RepID=A0A660L6C7_9ACTN|nr:hypothetical protein C8N24_5150 [Solirubrobacter pauli]
MVDDASAAAERRGLRGRAGRRPRRTGDGGHDAEDIGEPAGSDDRRAQAEVRDDVDRSDDARTPVGGHGRDDQGEGRGERGTEREPGDGLPAEHQRPAACRRAADDAERPDHGRRDPDGQRRPWWHPRERHAGDHRDRRRDEAGDPVEQAALAAEHAVHHARSQAPGEPREHPHGRHHGRGSEEGSPYDGRDRDPRDQRAERARVPAGGLRRGDDRRATGDGERAEGDERDRARRRRQLDRDAGEQRTTGKAAGQTDAGEDRSQPPAVRRCELHERRGEGSGRRATRETLHDAPRDHPSDVGRAQEHEVGHQLDEQGADQHRPPTDVIRQCADGQRGGEEADRVHGEGHRQQHGREVPLLAVDHQQRCQGPGREVHARERGRRTRQGQAGGKRAPFARGARVAVRVVGGHGVTVGGKRSACKVHIHAEFPDQFRAGT